jgi:hypothetical protein
VRRSESRAGIIVLGRHTDYVRRVWELSGSLHGFTFSPGFTERTNDPGFGQGAFHDALPESAKEAGATTMWLKRLCSGRARVAPVLTIGYVLAGKTSNNWGLAIECCQNRKICCWARLLEGARSGQPHCYYCRRYSVLLKPNQARQAPSLFTSRAKHSALSLWIDSLEGGSVVSHIRRPRE